MTTQTVPEVDVTFIEEGFNQDPFPELDRIRALGPVVYARRQRRYLVTGFRDCTRVLGDTRQFDSCGSRERVERLFGGQTMETTDDRDRHGAMRGVWAVEFRRDAMRRHEELILASVDRLLLPFAERIRSGEHVDAAIELTRGIPTLVIAGLLGIDAAMYPQFSAWSDAMGAKLEAALDDSERTRRLVADGDRATRELNDYVADLLQERRAAPGDDLISTMVADPYARGSMSDRDMVAGVTQLVFAGNETTAGLMAATVATLAEHPDQRRDVAADPELCMPAFEEVHRWRTLSQGGSQRFANSDSSAVAGVPIPRGSEVMTLLGAANRDPGRWEDADAFDVHRARKSHLGFGFGMHSCLGISLARVEVQIFIRRLLEELPDLTLAEPPGWGTGFLARKPVTVVVAA